MILPTSYLPNTEYFHHLLNADKIIIATNETYPKQTLRNRCTILNANGLQHLTVPVERISGDLLTKDVRISYAEDWQKNHLRSIESAYRRTPYYEYYSDTLTAIISKKHVLLNELNFELLKFLVDKTGLSCALETTSDHHQISKEIHLSLLPKAGTGFNGKPYIQTFSDRFGFQNNLSIIDLLFNEGPNSICVLQESEYKPKG